MHYDIPFSLLMYSISSQRTKKNSGVWFPHAAVLSLFKRYFFPILMPKLNKILQPFFIFEKGEKSFIPLLYLPAYTLAKFFASISHEGETVQLLFSIFPKRNALLATSAIVLMMIVHIVFTKKVKDFSFS